MSIKNCQAIQKSCLDRESNAWFTLVSESESMVCDTLCRLPVTVLKSLNDRQSDIFLKFKESKFHIQLKIWYVDYDMNTMSTEKSYAFQNIFFRCFSLLYVWESMQYCSQVVTTLSWHLNYFLSSVTLAFGGKFLAHTFIQCRSILLSCSIIRCSSYLPLFAFVYWMSIHSVKWNFPPKARVTLDRK